MMELWFGIGIFTIAFICEYIDSTFGMGYGTTLTPLLLGMGFEPLQIVPAILVSEFITGMAAAFVHHEFGNVHFDFKNDSEHEMVKKLGKLGYLPKSQASKIFMILAACSVVGAVIAVLISVNMPKFYLKLYIGILVLTMGLIILWRRKKEHKFTWKRVTGLGILAAFNKGMSGGGYGPVMVSGQVLTGVDSKSAIGITSLAESVTCLVGIIMFFILGTVIDWTLTPYLTIGALASVPFCAITVKKMDKQMLVKIIGIITVILGVYTLYNLFV
ncbi:sulfite exporter TauE/SafE family protein [Candidatus Micrarchaeota archaeon]|nr:sulfite exporter TauE/SafE family protein [Candidatus Micrarchaeota archaeon]